MKEANKIILYQDDDEITRVSVRFADEDLWLTQNQLADIYLHHTGEYFHAYKKYIC